ncbi:putative WUSCHEL-related homeobox 3 [Sesbania bispinosa]|nr:putative WUSCHEL-related homeobox 3 [Sesbania bispinosa]
MRCQNITTEYSNKPRTCSIYIFQEWYAKVSVIPWQIYYKNGMKHSLFNNNTLDLFPITTTRIKEDCTTSPNSTSIIPCSST